MAYCVKCGVELDDKLETCPLCGIPAIDPETLKPKQIKEENPLPFSGITSREISEILTQPIMHRIPHKTAAVFSITMLIPVITVLLIDVLTNNAVTWSFYPILSVLYVWISLVFPFLFKTGKRLNFLINFTVASVIFLLLMDGFIPPVSWAWYPIMSLLLLFIIITTPAFIGKRYTFPSIIVYTVATALFLWFLKYLAGGQWFLTLALPLTLLTGGLALLVNGINTLLIKGNRPGHKYTLAASAFVVLAGLSIGIDIICTLYITNRSFIDWSFYVSGAALLVAVFLYVAGGNERFRNLLEKKFHV
ncbi:MAG: hypothetical protein HQ557_14400 [Bacteroidetes bacterium]|nr:hypothetical protein [Bacteroidota bacterium]